MFRFAVKIDSFTENVPKLMARLKEKTRKNFPKYMMMMMMMIVALFGLYCP